MPVSVPGYGAAYSEAEQETNAGLICAFIDTSNTNIGTNKTAAVAAINAMKRSAKISNGLLNTQKDFDAAIAAFA